jgi:hypothetical protein
MMSTPAKEMVVEVLVPSTCFYFWRLTQTPLQRYAPLITLTANLLIRIDSFNICP